MTHLTHAVTCTTARFLPARKIGWIGLILLGCLAGCSPLSPPDGAAIVQHCDEIAKATVLWVSEDLADPTAGISAVGAEIRKVTVDGPRARIEIDCSVRYRGPTVPCKSFSSAGLGKVLPPAACESDLVSRVAMTLVERHDGSRWVVDSFQAKSLPK